MPRVPLSSQQVHFNAAGTLLLTCSGDKTTRVWDVQEGTCVKTLEGHSDEVFAALFNYTSDVILTGSKDNTLRLWR